MRLIPIILLLWHTFTLLVWVGGPFQWALEGSWMLVYFLAFLAVFDPNFAGYLYLILLVGLNVGWELWISSLAFDGVRLISYFLPSLVLGYLYLNHTRFSISKKYAALALLILAFLLLETGYFSLKICQYKFLSEAKQWSLIHTGYEAKEISWIDSDTIVAEFLQSRGPKEDTRFVSSLNFSTGEYCVIDERGLVPKISRDGLWIGYYRKLGWIPEGNIRRGISEFVWYNIATGEKETLYRHIEGRDIEFTTPGGIMLSNTLGGIDRFFALDGTTAIAQKKNDPYFYICTLSGQVLNKIPLPHPNGPDFRLSQYSKYIYINSFAEFNYYNFDQPEQGWRSVANASDGTVVSPDGQYIYNCSNGELSYYDLNSPQSGWHVVDSGIYGEYTLGVGGLVVFTRSHGHQLYGSYKYLYKKDLITQGLWLYRPGMTVPKRITSEDDAFPSLSPDGKTIAFSRDYEQFPYLKGSSELLLLREE